MSESPYAMAQALIETDPEAALVAWRALAVQEPNAEEPLLRQGACLQKLGRFQEAEAFFHKALDANPSSLGALSGLADVSVAKEDWTEGYKRWTEVRSQHPNWFWGHFWQANMLGRMGDFSGSIDMLDQVLTKFPAERLPVTGRMIELHLELKQPGPALVLFKELVEMGAERNNLQRYAWWIIRVTLGGPGFPPSIFGLDRDLLKFARA